MLVNLAKGIVGEGSARLVRGLIAMRLVAAVQTQMRVPPDKRKELTVYLDEFQTYATEHLAGALRERPQLNAAVDYARKGDTVVVWKLRRMNVATSTLYRHLPAARAIVTRGEPAE